MKDLRSGIVATGIATILLIPLFSIAGDASNLAGIYFSQNRDLINSAMKGRNYVIEVDRLGKIKQVVDAGANGSGQDALQTASMSSAIRQTAPYRDAVSSVEMPVNYQGQAALDFIGDGLPAIAEQHGLSPDKLKEFLLTDATIRVDSGKRIFYADDSAEKNNPSDGLLAAADVVNETMADSPQLPIGMTPATVNAFKLHSSPGASKTIYLDFNGYTAVNSLWSSSTLVAPPFDLDGNPNTFNTNELGNIISIWGRVAEDFIPFDVDVTTEEPPTDALHRSSLTDHIFGTRVVITKSGTIRCYCGGLAYVGVVAAVNNTELQPAWVFHQALANNEKYIAETVSHEAGHNLGLFHDGQKTGNTVNYYYDGHGTGVTAWAPIMGLSYYQHITQWSNGAYPGANNQQDDLAVLAANGFDARTDDTGNTFATASPLASIVSGTSAAIQATGVIENSNDVDIFRIDTTGGLLSLTVNPVAKGSNLDTNITLFKEDGAIVAASALEQQLSAGISIPVSAGAYFLAVKGSGHAASGADFGYPRYGSLGQYRITGTYTASGAAAIPQAVLTASKLSGPSSLAVNFSAGRSVGHGNITRYQWSFGDGGFSTSRNPAHTYTKAGTYRATLSVTNQFQLTNTKTTKIKVTPAPQARLYASSLKLNLIKNSNISAKAAITVVDGKKRPVANAVVRGFWSDSVAGSAGGKTGANGIAVLAAKPRPVTGGGSTTFTITGIEARGYAYRPELNARKVATVTW